ncbi:hypothetical protein HUT06_11195 [Actinomadura sp. NAK00032]|uniref:hypothetical protein n=1 Tax=Actinomadura sp. NAK00032 TaxID=2742128 RepID=UPI00159145B2|nr:hypothetical protein [Actinomadura sp. NAK00032]QKW34521.1 hypothetical protein HUT06_11195 [Actinomadura sp. NAK00032]
MTLALLILVCVLAALVFIAFSALVEMFHQLKQIREYLEIEDSPVLIDLGDAAGTVPSAAGLPAELDTAGRATVLFLSNKCRTCFTLAAALQGRVRPPGLWIVVVPVLGDAAEFIDLFDLRGERVVLDEDEHVVNRLGIDATPAAVLVEDGRMVKAHSVPSSRQMFAALPPLEGDGKKVRQAAHG